MTTPVTGTVSAEGKDFAKRIRRGIAAEEQRIVGAVFGPKVVTWVEATNRLARFVVNGELSPVRRVQDVEHALAAIGRADPDQKFHRIARGASGRRVLQVALETILLSEHPIAGVEGERCIQIVRSEYQIDRHAAMALPAPALAFSGHALVRLFERASPGYTAETVAAMLFRMVRVSQLLLDDAEHMRHFVRTELALPLPYGDAVALAPVRATSDPSTGVPTLWPDVRTVLKWEMATEDQRAQALRIGALIAAIDAGALAEDLDAMRDTVEPLPLRREDHVLSSIREARAAKIASQRARPRLTFSTPGF